MSDRTVQAQNSEDEESARVAAASQASALVTLMCRPVLLPRRRPRSSQGRLRSRVRSWLCSVAGRGDVARRRRVFKHMQSVDEAPSRRGSFDSLCRTEGGADAVRQTWSARGTRRRRSLAQRCLCTVREAAQRRRETTVGAEPEEGQAPGADRRRCMCPADAGWHDALEISQSPFVELPARLM